MMKRYILILMSFVLLALLMPRAITAQISHGGQPYSFSMGSAGKDFVVDYDEIKVAAPDVAALMKEDNDHRDKGDPPRVGVSIAVDFDMYNSGTWTDLPFGAKLWTLKVSADGAKALTLAFDDFHLATGSKLFFYNENRKQVLGAFTEENNLKNRTFTVEPVQGESVYIEYYEPGFHRIGDDNIPTTFHLYSVSYFYYELSHLAGYRDITAKDVVRNADGACMVDINCTPVGDDWQDEKRGVAKIIFKSGGGQYLCTGSLINKVNPDGTPYFLTAFHCGADNTTPDEFNEWTFLFGYEAPANKASGSGTNPSLVGGTDPRTTKSITGCSLVSKGSISGGSDFQLLLLSQTPDISYAPYYNGWTRSTNASPSGAGIHHPAGDLKKISTYSSQLATSSYRGSDGSNSATNAHWKVTWAANENGHGVTQGGSSGSPLFNNNGLIVGTLTGGSSQCNALTSPDLYGKISYHWTSNGTAANQQLKPWLDPDNTNVESITGYDPFANEPPIADFTAYPTTVIQGNEVQFEDRSISNPVDYAWTFEQGTPGTATGINPTVTYNTLGDFDVSLTVSNSHGSDVKTKEGLIHVIDVDSNYCDTLVQFCCGAGGYVIDNGYVSGTNGYNITAWAERFTSYEPFNKIYGMRLGIIAANNATNPQVNFRAWAATADGAGEVLATKSIALSEIATALNNSESHTIAIDIMFDEPFNIPETGFYLGFERPGTPAQGDTLAIFSNQFDGSLNTGWIIYENEWHEMTSFINVSNFQYWIFPFGCYTGAEPPSADFIATPTSAAIGRQIQFNYTGSGRVPESYLWAFEGGTPATSTDSAPLITYNTIGDFDVSLVVTSSAGNDTVIKPNYIQIFDPRFSLNFEECADFQVDNFDPWTTVDKDGLTTYGVRGLTFPNAGYTGSFIVFNADLTDPASTGGAWEAHGGDRCGVAIVGQPTTAHPRNNDWLISPQITLGTYSSIEFYAKSYSDEYGLEPFRVLVSTGGAEVGEEVSGTTTGDFTLISDDPVVTTTEWTKYSYDLSDYDNQSIRVGIQYISKDLFAFMIDDINIITQFNMPPTADFTSDTTVVEQNAAVQFSDLSRGATAYEWTFEGGTPATSTAREPVVTYANTGTFSVSLTVSNSSGEDTETKTGYITVVPPQEVIAEWNFPDNGADSIADAGIPENLDKVISMSGMTTAPTIVFTTNGATTKCISAAGKWQNGQNKYAWLANFTTRGYKNIKVFSKQTAGKKNSPRDFKIQYSLDNTTWNDIANAPTIKLTLNNWANATSIVDNLALPDECNNQENVYVRWVMNTNKNINNSNLSRYALDPTLLDDVIIKGVKMPLPPLADFAAASTEECVNVPIQFNDASLYNPQTWSWDFGDGATASVQNPTHTYATAGTYTVTLTVGNANGTDSKTRTGYITIKALPTLTVDGSGPYCAESSMTLTANGNAANYAWTGPNNFVSQEQSPTLNDITASQSGTYTVVATGSNGCSSSAQINVTVNAIPEFSTGGGGTFCEGQSVNMTTNVANYDYSWTGPNSYAATGQNATLADITTSQSGTYTVVATNADNCTSSRNIVVNVNPNPTINTGNASGCEGSDIELTTTGTGGSAYSWTGPNGFQSTAQSPIVGNATAANEGSYTVTLQNTTTGCSSEAEATVTVYANPSVAASNDGNICVGQTIGLSASGNGTEYSWTGPNEYTSAVQNPSIASATASQSGSYTVTARNEHGCEATASTSVVVNANPVFTAGGAGSYCENQTVNLTANNNGYDYVWSGPNGFSSTAQNPTLTGVTASQSGTYTVVATDDNRCSSSQSIAITVNTNPVFTAGGGGSLCENQTMSLTTNNNDYNYAWTGPNSYSSQSRNPTVAGVTASQSGNYTVVATDNNRCSSSQTVDVVVHANPTVTTRNAAACEGNDIRLTATGTGTAYSWTGPNSYAATGQNATLTGVTASQSGSYTVVTRNEYGCTSSATAVVTVNANPTVNLGDDQTVCPNTELTLDAGDGFNGYSWSTQTNTRTITVSATGNYAVTVYDGNNCSGSDEVSISNYPQTTLTFSTTAATSSTLNNGSATVTAAGNDGPYTYSWSNGGTAATISNVAGGRQYTVTVSDNHGCQTTGSVSVSIVGVAPTAGFTANRTNVCEGENITFTDTSINMPTQWSWTFAGGTPSTSSEQNPTVTYSANGVYEVSLTVYNDQGLNTSTKTDYITVNANPTMAISGNTSYCEGSTITLSAQSDATTYRWSGAMGTSSNANTFNISNVTTSHTGVYTVVGTSAAGCSVSAEVNVEVHANPDFTVSGGSSFCEGQTVNLTVNNDSYGYSWSGPNGYASQEQNPTLTGVTTSQSGSYTVIATENNTETPPESNEVTVHANPSVATGDIAGCEGSNIQLTANGNANGYSWTGPNGYTSQEQNPTLAGVTTSQSGSYTVVATGAYGCSNTATAVVTINANPVITVAATNDGPQCEGSDVTLSAAAEGNVGYAWSGPNGYTAATAEALATEPGEYTVVISDAVTGCSTSSTTNVRFYTAPTVTIAEGNQTVCANTVATLTATAGFTSYRWNDNIGTNVFNAIDAGDYTVVVTDVHNCEASATATVTHTAVPTLTLTSTSETTSGQANGTATVSVSGGTTPYQIRWNTGATDDYTIYGLTNGTYGVTVSDANGCSASGSVTVSTLHRRPDAHFTASVTEGCAPLTVRFTDASDNHPTSWAWVFSEGNTSDRQNPTFTFEQAGTYTVLFTAGNSDGSDNTFMHITVYPVPEAGLSNEIMACEGTPFTLTATPNLTSYLWSTGESTNATEVTTSGTYSLQLSNEYGCTSNTNIAVTFNPVPAAPQLGGDIIICSNSQHNIDAGSGYATYLWNTGDTTQVITVDSGETYAVTVTNEYGCQATSSVAATLVTAPTVDIAYDNEVCTQAPFTYTLNGDYDSYRWINGSTTNTFETSWLYAGDYNVWVEVEANGCTARDTMTITVVASPTLELSHESVVCTNTPFTYTIGQTYDSYLWSDSTMANTFTATWPEAGSYDVWVNIEHNGCPAVDTMTITVVETPTITLSHEGSICSNSPFAYTVEQEYDSYLWSDGTTSNTFAATWPDRGNYDVWVEVGNGVCSSRDTMTITVVETPEINLEYDNEICTYSAFTYTIGQAFDRYLWSDSTTTNTFTASWPDAGDYNVWVEVGNNGCVTRDTMTITVVDCPTDISDATTTACSLFPNPSTDITYLAIANFTGKLSYTLSDISGKEISAETIEVNNEVRHQLNIQNLMPGMYILNVNTGKDIYRFKLIKR